MLASLSLFTYPLALRLKNRVFGLLAGAMLLAAALLVYTVAISPRTIVPSETYPWIPQLLVQVSFRLDALSTIFALLVTVAGALVLFYCRHYFSPNDATLPRFAANFMGFSTSMLGLVIADNVFLIFIFWEATTVFSFLLIGHVLPLRTANAAALQALVVTTAGGLSLFVGFVLLVAASGTAELSQILRDPPGGTILTVATYLLLIGALSKSAIFPLHFWLPGAMAAPTPVSAYLHAAAMVKAGIFLIIRINDFAPATPGYRWTLVLLGAITMLNGGLNALRQHDIKLLVAYSTVSQLGLLVMIIGLADPRTTFAGVVLLISHAIAKAPLFLIVGIIDRSTGVRDLRKLSGLGLRYRWLLVLAVLAAAAMAGAPPLFGFIAKEALFHELLALRLSGTHPTALLIIAGSVAIIGSMLTVAYMCRFLWGAFGNKAQVPATPIIRPPTRSFYIAPAVFSLLTVLGTFCAALPDRFLRRLPGASEPATAAALLQLWPGFTPLLLLSVLILGGGVALFFPARRYVARLKSQHSAFSASHLYWLFTHYFDVFAVRVTQITQRGSLPFYLAVIISVFALCGGMALLPLLPATQNFTLFTQFSDFPIALTLAAAAIFAMRARSRFQAGMLVGVTGYALAAFFALRGAPDLALTQLLVETMTLIAFVLVIRRLPQKITREHTRLRRGVRLLLGLATGLVLALAGVVALSGRIAAPISAALPDLALYHGHGQNVVNVMLVDIRGMDTLGELSVILAAATGVASLVFVNTRVDTSARISRKSVQQASRQHLLRIADPDDPVSRPNWLLAGQNLHPGRRSIILEVAVRLIFHALLLLSIFLLFSGHNAPGGGFAGGLVAGLALAARYLAGGRYELRATVPLDAGRILGTGLGLAVTMALMPLLFGHPALSSFWYELDLGVFGTLPVITSALFDVGVYLVVFGLVLDVLRSLGSEIDIHEEAEAALFATAAKGAI